MPQLLIPGRLLDQLCKCLCVLHPEYAPAVCELLPGDGPVCLPCQAARTGLVAQRREHR